MKKNIWITIIAIGLLIIGLAFYWYQWRPSHIIGLCAKDAISLANTDMRGYYLSQLPNVVFPNSTTERPPFDTTRTYSLDDFGQIIKTTYPVYNEKSNTDIATRFILKYPAYKGLLSNFESPVGDPQYDNYYNVRYQNCLKENGLEK